MSQKSVLPELKQAEKSRGMRRYWWVFLAIFAIIGGLWWGFGGQGQKISYVTKPVEVGQLEVSVSATGSVEPTHRVDISSELSGTLRQVLVDFNDRVEKGQILATLDTSKLDAQVMNSRARAKSAQAQVTLAKATVKEAERELARKTELAGVVSRSDIDAAEAVRDRALAALASAEADVEVAAASLAVDETNLSKSSIVSPISGIILKREAEPGQTVASSLQAPILFSIAEDLKSMEVQVDVDEADIGAVKPGQKARFSVDAYPGQKFEAEVREVRYASEVVQGVVTYTAILGVDNSELLLRPGMTATAEILTQDIRDALLIPNAALRFSPPMANAAVERSILDSLIFRPRFSRSSPRSEQRPGVWILGQDGAPKRVEITIGPSDGRYTQVLSGLQAGDGIITATATAKK